MKCPVCTNVDLLLAERQGVEIDYCPNCRGVWLDRGELDKIIERQPAGSTTYQTDQRHAPRQEHAERNQQYDRPEHHDKHGRQYSQDDHYDERKHGQGKRKGGSFLGDLFDF
jgi:Zn-finger nucleic acid-binding protein